MTTLAAEVPLVPIILCLKVNDFSYSFHLKKKLNAEHRRAFTRNLSCFCTTMLLQHPLSFHFHVEIQSTILQATGSILENHQQIFYKK